MAIHDSRTITNTRSRIRISSHTTLFSLPYRNTLASEIRQPLCRVLGHTSSTALWVRRTSNVLRWWCHSTSYSRCTGMHTPGVLRVFRVKRYGPGLTGTFRVFLLRNWNGRDSAVATQACRFANENRIFYYNHLHDGECLHLFTTMLVLITFSSLVKDFRHTIFPLDSTL